MAVNNGNKFSSSSSNSKLLDVNIGRGGDNPYKAMAGTFSDIGSMRTYLLANGYNSAQLDSMTQNDMVYAIRTKAFPNSIR